MIIVASLGGRSFSGAAAGRGFSSHMPHSRATMLTEAVEKKSGFSGVVSFDGHE
jgi:hypothetical protein